LEKVKLAVKMQNFELYTKPLEKHKIKAGTKTTSVYKQKQRSSSNYFLLHFLLRLCNGFDWSRKLGVFDKEKKSRGSSLYCLET